MIAYQSYNQEPLNGEAARWVDQHLDELPLRLGYHMPDERNALAGYRRNERPPAAAPAASTGRHRPRRQRRRPAARAGKASLPLTNPLLTSLRGRQAAARNVRRPRKLTRTDRETSAMPPRCRTVFQSHCNETSWGRCTGEFLPPSGTNQTPFVAIAKSSRSLRGLVLAFVRKNARRSCRRAGVTSIPFLTPAFREPGWV